MTTSPAAAVCIGVLLCTVLTAQRVGAQPTETALRQQAQRALKQAVSYYRQHAASHGGYVYGYSEDLSRRWGEGEAARDTIFVQPPGTPAVGRAFLDAYNATGDAYYLDAARATASALVHGQLESGGWAQVIHFAPPTSGRLGKYRVGRPAGSWNVSSLDDDQTQAALQLLMYADQALKFQDTKIHEAVLYGLDALLAAQFPNGAFPQGWTGPAEAHPVLAARYPDYDWKTEGKGQKYSNLYTLNDNLAGTVAETLIAAHQVYQDDRYLAALQHLGDFLILAQMPDPQPGWCQQYTFDMFPAWARRFEPPAITGGESQDAMRTLIRIARYTGQTKYLEPIPKALAYFRHSLLADGRVARYYELKTNRPLYMDEQYRLTYDDANTPSHYSWKQAARFDQIERDYQVAIRGENPSARRVSPPSADRVRRILEQLDEHGRWVSTYNGERLPGRPELPDGCRYLSSEVFCRNVELLSEFLAATATESAVEE